jgi:hypothetical protein
MASRFQVHPCAWLLMAATLVVWARPSSAEDLLSGYTGPEATATTSGSGAASAVNPDNGGGSHGLKTSYEADVDVSYVGGARTNFGQGRSGGLSEQDTNGRFVVMPQWNDGPIYRFGLGYQRFSFGIDQAAPLPNALQSENLIVGADFSLFNSWLVRVEAYPGFYGDARNIGGSDFDVPFIIGGSYIASADVQWVVGLGVDINRRWPVFPDVGVRWSFAGHWTLDAVLPSPRLEYEWNNDLTLYAGGDFQDGTYRVSGGLGNGVGQPRLNHAVVEYDEIRVGAGISWKASHAFTIEMEGGYLPYRQFDFERARLHYGNESGAPYGQISVGAKF